MDDVYLTKQEVAYLCSVHVSTVERAVKDGRLPAPTYQLGPRSPRWSKTEVVKAMQNFKGEDNG